jgi:transposase
MLDAETQSEGQRTPGLWTGGHEMKYTKEERLDIGRRIYTGEIDRYDAARVYGISLYTARDYMRLYQRESGLPAHGPRYRIGKSGATAKPAESSLRAADSPQTMAEYESMTKEELILELMRSRIREARAKKGYEVKGVGAEKVFVLLDSENTK